jgi:PIN domain nuclease of toxin-antitoxin system
MKAYITDTMAIVSYLGKRKLPVSVKSIFQSADLGALQILIPAIVLVEIGYLSEKGRIDISIDDVLNHISTFPTYLEQPLTFILIVEAYKITDIPELHDRLIGATSKFLNLELITNDPLIQASAFVKTIW